VLGFAVIAGVAAVIVLVILGIKARDWLRAMLAGQQPGQPPARTDRKVTDVTYEIVDRRDDTKR